MKDCDCDSDCDCGPYVMGRVPIGVGKCDRIG